MRTTPVQGTMRLPSGEIAARLVGQLLEYADHHEPILVPWETAMSVEFLVTSFIVIVSPGTGVLYTLATGLSRGFRASVVAAFGCTVGIVPHMVAAIVGLAALLHTSALAFQTFKYLGVAYLLYMAWHTWREHERAARQ